MRDLRRIPSSPESEAALLGGLLLDSEAIHRVPNLAADAFHNEQHANVFRAIQKLAAAGQPIETVSVYTEMTEAGHQIELYEVNELAQYVPSAVNLRRFADVVMDCYSLRQLMEAGAEISDLAMTPGHHSAEQLDKAQMLLAKLGTVKAKRDPQHINDSMASYLQLLQDMSEGKNSAIPTGIGGLDQLLNGGQRRGEVLVLGARPKHGKTALSLAMARYQARRNAVLFLSQEMKINELMHRHTAATGPFDLGRIRAADPADSDMWKAVTEAARRLGELNLLHDDQCNLTLMEIRRKAVKTKREHGLDVLYIDFLQLMDGAGEENRNRELDVIVNGIKGLAMDLDCAVVLLSQLSREADKHYGRPVMTHLRDSGAIEAAADQIAMLFTDHKHPMSKKLPALKGYAELEIVAHRNGPQGVIPLELIGKYQQFGDWMGENPKRSGEPGRAPINS
ncbi:AAA family ATPase [Acidovorax sp. LjRoot66]|uniref:replicative DNA helicase n=1 Tax=Acidovorax sp. LjRoot66 TaxID=3342334 RepID=UPI003ECD4B8E